METDDAVSYNHERQVATITENTTLEDTEKVE